MSSLFGGPKPNTFGSIPSTGFGNTNNNQSTAPGGFGTQPVNAAPSLFGATAGNSATGVAPNPFGSNATQTSNPSPFPQLNNPNPGIPSSTAPSGNTFGGVNPTAPTSGLFGNSSFGTSSFGNTNANASANNAPGTGLFGSTNQNANAAQTSTTGGIFGNPAQPNASGGGLFGNLSNTTASSIPTGGGLFGQPNNATNNASGSTTNPGFFGNTNLANNPPNTGGFGGGTTTLFGQTQQQPAPQQLQPPQPTTTLFGSGIPNQSLNQSQSLFAPQGSTNKLGSSLLSSTLGPQASTSLFGPRSSSSLQTPSLSANSQVDIQQRIEAIAAAWDPSSPQCRFQHYFYNLVDPNQVNLYGRPQNATNDALWNQAVRENPDPKCMVPVLALGFDDLQKRVDAQSAQAKQHTEKLKELQTRLTALGQTHVLSTTRNTTRVLQTHTLITHRLLRFVEHIHLLIPNLRSAAISPEEESLRANLERLRDELSSGNGRGRLNELWALLGAVKAAQERGGSEAMEWKVVDWDGLEKLAGILAEQQQGLAHLTSVINNGLKDLQIMGNGSQGTLPESTNSNYLMSSMLGHPR